MSADRLPVCEETESSDGAQEEIMRIAGAAAFLILAGTAPAVADEMPTRKAGLWEIKTEIIEIHTPKEHIMGAPTTIRQCTDDATDEMLLLSTVPFGLACPRRDVERSGDTVTIKAACTIDNEPASADAVISGRFDSAYTMTLRASRPGSEMTEAQTAKWLGPCAADQKPGDIVRDGRKTNILDRK
jgi:hypothetical protein